jgi:hypothetical protein
MFEPPINLAQIQMQFPSWIFNSMSVSNLNLLPEEKLFTMSQATHMQRLDNFGAKEGSFWYFTNQSKFENSKNVCVADWARPRETVAQVSFKPTAPTCEYYQSGEPSPCLVPTTLARRRRPLDDVWDRHPLSLLQLFKGPVAKASVSFLQLPPPPRGVPPPHSALASTIAVGYGVAHMNSNFCQFPKDFNSNLFEV